MSSFRSNSWRTPLPARSGTSFASFACPFPFRVIPNLPDVVLRKVFSMLSYKELCACEVVCRRWQTIIHQQMKKDIHEITLESIGSYKVSAMWQKGLKRLAVSCPSTSADFLGGLIRRHRLSLSRLTTDFRFLSTIDSIKVNKDARRKYFGKVDDLWVLVVGCRDEDVQHYRAVEERIFNELTTLTLQLMVSSRHVIAQNAIVVTLFSLRHPQAHMTLELHADNANLIFTQLEALESITLLKIKIICTEFNLPTLQLEKLSEILATKQIRAKIITFRDWTLSCDGVTPVVPCPLDTFRISSCTIDSVDALVDSFKAAVKQAAPKKLVKKVVKKKAEEQPPTDEEPKPKKALSGQNGVSRHPVELKNCRPFILKLSTRNDIILKRKTKNSKSRQLQAKVHDDPMAWGSIRGNTKIVRKVVKKRPPVVKRVEVAGQCTLRGLDFLHHKAHMELENRLSACVPSIEVDTSEIYYWDSHMTD